MKKETARKLRLCGYALAWLLMLAYPVARIIQFECPSEQPTTVLIRVNGFDPYDPFRGSHVRLNTRQELTLPPEAPEARLEPGRKLYYATMQTDERGVATFTGLHATRQEIPASILAMKVKHAWCAEKKATADTPASYTCHFSLPFEHFYLNEKEAPKAQELLNHRDAEILLKVKIYRNGDAIAEDILIDGQSVHGLSKP